jgi:hypothetical protein
MDASGTRTSDIWHFAIKCPSSLSKVPILVVPQGTFMQFSGSVSYGGGAIRVIDPLKSAEGQKNAVFYHFSLKNWHFW